MSIKRYLFVFCVLFLASSLQPLAAQEEKPAQVKVILLIAEQNIEGPQRAWWASEIDLSATETTVAKRLIEAGLEVLEPESLNEVIEQKRAFRVVNISQSQSVKLGNLAQADYVILGRAIASSAGNVPQSTLRSSFANVTARLIRVKGGKVIAYLTATGSSAHPDVITGGREALDKAGEELSGKILQVLKNQEGDKKE